ncbi:hypothetical protein KY330_03955 [Candidatus Woesearchaeota archaeon]|nr:hypothetical protein [Candidatus Woesearchaeota archaeon]
MSEKNKSSGSGSNDGLGCFLSTAVGIAGLVATLSLGPIDFTRTVYNQIIGDTPVIKRQLVDYVRKNTPHYSTMQALKAEYALAKEMKAEVRDGRINPDSVSIETLWDLAEDYAKSSRDRWWWTDLD